MGNSRVTPPWPQRGHCWSEGCSNIDSIIHSSSGNIIVGTWNVEGLTDIKIEQLSDYMTQFSIGILCIQEVRRPKSDVFVTTRGFQIILSGSSTLEREWAGVGFVVAPRIRKSVAGFCQFSSRAASLKVKIVGGTFAVLSAYAPHNMKDISETSAFCEDLHKLLRKKLQLMGRG